MWQRHIDFLSSTCDGQRVARKYTCAQWSRGSGGSTDDIKPNGVSRSLPPPCYGAHLFFSPAFAPLIFIKVFCNYKRLPKKRFGLNKERNSDDAPSWSYWSAGITNTIGQAMEIEALKDIV